MVFYSWQHLLAIWDPSYSFRIAHFDPAQVKQLRRAETYKVHNFCKISAVESQKGGGLHKFIKRQEPEHKHKQVILDCYRSEIFLLYNKSYIDQACWSRWPDISLVLFLFAF